ncbi:MAG: YcaO-like family protein [Verrucomicrobiota bacterium]
MTCIPIERSYSLQDAEAALLKELEALGLNHDIEIAGESILTAKCTLSDKKTGRFLASGNGKGELIASRAGSLFEATEHLLSKYHSLDPDKIFYMNSLDYCRDNPMCDQLPLVLLKSGESADIPFLKHHAVNGRQTCFYPLALTCPEYIDLQLLDGDLRRRDSFNYGRLEHYSTNSGTAIGMNAEEAMIHGLLEGIERTSLSKFLADTFLKNKKNCLRMVNPLTMPSHIRDVLDRLEEEISSRILVFEMPNKFGVPAYVSWMEQYEFKIGIAGYGCSLSVEHAILRCLYELSQYYLLSKHIFGFDWLKSKSEAIQTRLKGLPLHQDCAVFDMGWKCRTLGCKTVDYENLPTVPFDHDTKKYLAQLTTLIYENGEVPYANELRVLGNGITVAHTFITGEDRFFNVKNCKSTFPASLKDFAG